MGAGSVTGGMATLPASGHEGEASLTDEVPKAPIKLNVTAGTPHKVEKIGIRFMAYWNGRVVYQNGESNDLKPLMRRLHF